MLGSKEALGAAVGFSPALVPGWAERAAACEALPWERWSTGVVIVARAVVSIPIGLLHVHKGSTVIWTREFLYRLELWWLLWFTPSFVPPSFLGVDGGTFFLF